MLEKCLKNLADKYFACDVTKLSTHPIENGFSGFATYKLEYLGNTYFLKLLSKATQAEKQRLINHAKLASQHGLAPEILYVPSDESFALQAYIAQPILSDTSFQDINVWQRVVDTLRQIHSLPLQSDLTALTLRESSDSYIENTPKQYRSIITETHDWQYMHDVELRTDCMVHGDFHPDNVFITEKVLFIDWEFSGRGDPAQDLAAVCMYLPPEVHKDVYDYYFQNQTPQFSFEKLLRMRRCTYLQYAAWALSQLATYAAKDYCPGRYHSLFETRMGNACVEDDLVDINYLEYASEIVRLLDAEG